jgi:hypothetical protein
VAEWLVVRDCLDSSRVQHTRSALRTRRRGAHALVTPAVDFRPRAQPRPPRGARPDGSRIDAQGVMWRLGSFWNHRPQRATAFHPPGHSTNFDQGPVQTRPAPSRKMRFSQEVPEALAGSDRTVPPLPLS